MERTEVLDHVGRFAAEVLPRLRAAAGTETTSEKGA
jgi:hypothetical protein